MNKWRFLDSFWLKVLALLFMSIDHLALLLSFFFLDDGDPIITTMGAIGRLALPLFAFMIYEGTRHTKHFGKYLLRLGILASLIGISLAILAYVPNPILSLEGMTFGNIFIDLLLGATAIYCLKHKEIPIKLLALLPICFGVLSEVVVNYESNNGIIIHWFPDCIRTQYGWYGITLTIGLYLGSLIKNEYLKNLSIKTGIEIDELIDSGYDRNATTLINVIIIVTISMAYYFLSVYINNPILSVQWCAFFSGALVLFYNGKRGYNKKWFQYGSYVYYPLHIVLLALLFYLITL